MICSKFPTGAVNLKVTLFPSTVIPDILSALSSLKSFAPSTFKNAAGKIPLITEAFKANFTLNSTSAAVKACPSDHLTSSFNVNS